MTPDQLRLDLIDTSSRGEPDNLLRLCQANRQMILASFKDWTTVPVEFRNDPVKLQTYANMLGMVASIFEHNGHPDLFECLRPSGGNDLLESWHWKLQHAGQMDDLGNRTEALGVAESLLREVEESGLSGSGIIDVRAKICGLMSAILFRLGRIEESRDFSHRALKDCELGGDVEGMRIYSENLRMIAEIKEDAEAADIDVEIEFLEMIYKAQHLANLCRFDASSRILSELLGKSGPPRNVVNEFRPQILARMGFNEYKLGRTARARKLLEEARDLCAARSDRTGTETYKENLLELAKKVPPQGGVFSRIKDFLRRVPEEKYE